MAAVQQRCISTINECSWHSKSNIHSGWGTASSFDTQSVVVVFPSNSTYAHAWSLLIEMRNLLLLLCCVVLCSSRTDGSKNAEAATAATTITPARIQPPTIELPNTTRDQLIAGRVRGASEPIASSVCDDDVQGRRIRMTRRPSRKRSNCIRIAMEGLPCTSFVLLYSIFFYSHFLGFVCISTHAERDTSCLID
jgi:hypothetical protein